MSTIFQKYAAALLPFFILVVGASQTVLHFGADQPVDWNAIITFAIVVLGAIVTFIVKLILSALLPFVLPGGFDPDVSVPIIIVAVLNAIATEFGVQIRTGDNAVSGGVVPDPESQPKHLAA